MRILYWTELFWPHIGGIETLSQGLIPALKEKGHEIEVITSHSRDNLPNKDLFNGIVIHRFPFHTALKDGNLRQLLTAQKDLSELKKSFQPDLIHIHFSGPSSFFHWRTPPSCPTLLTLHSIPWHSQGNNQILKNALQKSAWVSSVSASMLSLACDHISDPAKTSVIYNGMTPPDLLPTPLPSSTPVILCVGRLIAWKRFDWAIDLFAEVIKSFPNAKMLLIGDGEENENLKAHSARLGLENAVTFTGEVSRERLFELLNTATMVLIPSENTENIPYTAVEAGWMGRPVIASNVSGLPEIIQDGITGYLVHPQNKAEWLDRIYHLLNNPNLAQTIGNQANKHGSQKFAMGKCADEYDQLYHYIGGEM